MTECYSDLDSSMLSYLVDPLKKIA